MKEGTSTDNQQSIEPNNTNTTESQLWEHITILLTVIGLWLALPATCGLLQRIVDSFISIESIKQNPNILNALTIGSIILDICLLGVYIFGFMGLISVGFSAILAARLWVATNRGLKTIAFRGIKNIFLDLWKWFLRWFKWGTYKKFIKRTWSGYENTEGDQTIPQ